MLNGPNVILTLKAAVLLATVLLIASVVALALRRPRLHGWLNVVVAVLVCVAVIGLEIILRILGVNVTSHMDEAARAALNVHLCFSVPLVPVFGFMLVTGRKRNIKSHLGISIVFVILWVGTFVTGIFYLPHTAT